MGFYYIAIKQLQIIKNVAAKHKLLQNNYNLQTKSVRNPSNSFALKANFFS